jgi:hypothetical protein
MLVAVAQLLDSVAATASSCQSQHCTLLLLLLQRSAFPPRLLLVRSSLAVEPAMMALCLAYAVTLGMATAHLDSATDPGHPQQHNSSQVKTS